MARYLLYSVGKFLAQEAIRIVKHLLPSILQCRAYATIPFLTLELPLGFLLRFAADYAVAVEEAVKRRGRVGGALFGEIHAEKPTLFPASPSRRQIEPPDEAVREHRQRYAFVEGVPQQLFLMLGEVRARAFHLDENEIARRSTKTIVHSSTTDRVLASNLVTI